MTEVESLLILYFKRCKAGIGDILWEQSDARWSLITILGWNGQNKLIRPEIIKSS